MESAALDSLRIVLDPVGQAGVAAALMLVMFSVALGLSVNDFHFIRTKPVTYLGGVLTQVIGLPLLTLALLALLKPPASIALGMIVVACCPGGAVSNLLTYLSKGAVAYSVALTATSSILAAIVTPVSILFWSNLYPPTAELLQTIDVSPALFLIQTMVLLGVPLMAGMIVAARAPDVAERLRKPAWSGRCVQASPGPSLTGAAFCCPRSASDSRCARGVHRWSCAAPSRETDPQVHSGRRTQTS